MPIQTIRPIPPAAPTTQKRDEWATAIGRPRVELDAVVAAAVAAENASKQDPGTPDLSAADVDRLLDGVRSPFVAGLVTHAGRLDGEADLATWRAAWPTVLGPLSDAEASVLIRTAVGLAGGTIVEADGTETTHEPPPPIATDDASSRPVVAGAARGAAVAPSAGVGVQRSQPAPAAVVEDYARLDRALGGTS